MDNTTTRSASTRIRWQPAALGFLALAGLGALLAFGVAYARGGGSPKLEAAPDFTVPIYSGDAGQFTLSQQLGHPVVLNFWGSWCPPCRAEFPALQAVADQYEEEGLVVFGVDVQDTEVDARAFLDEQGTTFLTGPDTTTQVTIDYNVIYFPTTLFITRDGLVYKRWVGQIDEATLTTFIEEILKS